MSNQVWGRLLLALTITATAVLLPDVRADERPVKYQSPYSVRYTVPVGQLTHDLQRGERGEVRNESQITHAEWYAPSVRKRWKSWGPPARTYSALPAVGPERHSVEWKRERVIAVGMRFHGYDYQHHHVPDWNPPADWPWDETATGHNGKGVDCSNFTSFVYNQGFGILLDSEVQRQSELTQAEISGQPRPHKLQRIELPEKYSDRVKILRTGDLLFIRNAKGDRISHVTLWVGSLGQSTDSTPLILDSHGETVRDNQKKPIPTGVQLRPYRESSWYNRSASHALRVFHDENKPRSSR